MKDIHYAFCVAKIRALENRLLTNKDIASLTEMKSLKDALRFLTEKGYSGENEDIADIIKRHTGELNTLLYESVPDKKQLEALYILNDYFNLKVIVKCAVEKTNGEALLLQPSAIGCEALSSALEGDFDCLGTNFRTVAEEAYGIALKSKNGKLCDVIIDTAAINALAACSQDKNSGLLGEICAFLADTANIKAALRCVATSQDEDYIKEAVGSCCRLDRDSLIKAATTGSEALDSFLEATVYKEGAAIYLSDPSAFEKWCDDRVIEIADRALYTSFGFDPVVYYFYRKSLEIKTVRMILTAIKSDIDKSIIKGRVRELYA